MLRVAGEPGQDDALLGKRYAEDYCILHVLGSGGYGKVYLAWDINLERPVALKVLHPKHRDESRDLHRITDTLRRDGTSTAKVNGHPNVIMVMRSGVCKEDKSRFLVLEPLRGYTLYDAVAQGSLGAAKAVSWTIQACSGLHAVHKAGLVHRDVKLENLFVHHPSPHGANNTSEPILKIINFGLACDKGPPPNQTGTGPYMAPEQFIANENVDERTDVFGLGVTLYVLVTSSYPYAAEGGDFSAHLKSRMMQEPFRALERTSISPELDALIMRAISRSPDKRYSNMMELKDALEKTPEGRAATWKGWPNITEQLFKEPSSASIQLADVDMPVIFPNKEGKIVWPEIASDPKVIISGDRAIMATGGYWFHGVDVRPCARWFLQPSGLRMATMRRQAGGDESSLRVDAGERRDGLVYFDGDVRFSVGSSKSQVFLLSLSNRDGDYQALICLERRR